MHGGGAAVDPVVGVDRLRILAALDQPAHALGGPVPAGDGVVGVLPVLLGEAAAAAVDSAVAVAVGLAVQERDVWRADGSLRLLGHTIACLAACASAPRLAMASVLA